MATKQFTLRISTVVYSQIASRASVLGRSVNKEIETLLAWAIDRQSEADEATLQRMRDYLADTAKEKSPLDLKLEALGYGVKSTGQP